MAENSDSDVDRRMKSASFRGDSASLFRNLYEKKLVSEAVVSSDSTFQLSETVEIKHSTE